MKSYSIFIKTNKDNGSIDDVILIKEGFNFYAFIFGIFWFLVKKMWICSIIFLTIVFLISYFFCYFIAFAIVLLLLIFIGFEANDLLIKKFQKNNYYFAGYTTGNDEKEAKLRFLDDLNQENEDKNKIIY